MDAIHQYQCSGLEEESNWRSIVLFGRNVASYKFALAQALIDLAKLNRSIVSLEDLAAPYAAHLCEHVAYSPRQATSRTSKFIEACASFNQGDISHNALIEATVKHGLNYVLDAFHTVNQQQIPIVFFKKEFSRTSKRIMLTDEAFKIAASEEATNIAQETEARWNLVETAWRLGISPDLLDVEFDESGGGIIVESNANRRRNVTSARSALNGYQKGRCFYCYRNINAADGFKPAIEAPEILTLQDTSTSKGNPLCDVDHFFPHTLARAIRGANLDGIWNLVLACPDCNRGHEGKFARIPAIEYLERLHRRNEYLISSHHPLRETVIAQTGLTARDRWSFLKSVDTMASQAMPGARWKTVQLAEDTF